MINLLLKLVFTRSYKPIYKKLDTLKIYRQHVNTAPGKMFTDFNENNCDADTQDTIF